MISNFLFLFFVLVINFNVADQIQKIWNLCFDQWTLRKLLNLCHGVSTVVVNFTFSIVHF